jgi:hypothetical protein
MSGPRMPGPCGTNAGDVWLAEGSPVQQALDEREPGKKLVHEIVRRPDGSLNEALYTSIDSDLIARAEEGTVRYWQQKASEN